MANKIYFAEETSQSWRNTGGDELLTLTSLAAGAGRQGALHDFGAAVRTARYRFRLFIKMNTTPVVGEIVRLYWKTGDGTHYDNDDGTGDIALSDEDKLVNLTEIGTLIIDEAATGVEFSISGEFEHYQRYGGPVVFNDTADALSSTAADHGFDLIPIPDEVQ